jgi:dTDP-glucose pyrophosphorylase
LQVSGDGPVSDCRVIPKPDISQFVIPAAATIGQVMTCIDRNTKGIALVVDADGRLLNTVTDGDIRRSILAGVKLDAPLAALLERKRAVSRATPVTALAGSSAPELLRVMQEHHIRHLPLVDGAGRAVELATLDELLPSEQLPLQAVIMAGGAGTRLRPLTQDLPKPMLPVGGRPMLEHVIEQLRGAGINRVNITTHYKREVIENHFGDGHGFGVEVSYVKETQPLGTAGALGLMDSPKEPLLVVNGDILTRVDFRAMLRFHREHQADLTVAVRQYDVNVPFGVIETNGERVTKVVEKPVLNFFVNAGIYLLEPCVHQFIPNGQRYDMTELIQHLVAQGRRVVSFPVLEYWLDIGQHADYVAAQSQVSPPQPNAVL